jgi:DHA1 family bicyclomycin/chloramphenicol resistance-like MFS transporter
VFSKTSTFILIALGTVIGLAGTDLVLPAIPSLPAALGGDLQTAQFVLAAFAGGTGIGLLIYGELATRVEIGKLLIFSLLGYALLSFLATFASSLVELSLMRFIQGLIAAGPAVLAPVMIKSMYEHTDAVAALGRIGSIESLAPALAPILGAWLLAILDWKSSFYLTSIIALCLGLIWIFAGKTRLQFGVSNRSTDGYIALLGDGNFMRHALSQAFTLGALLIIVFAAPTVVIHALDGELSDFIMMQVLGISFFVVTANTSHHIIDKFGSVNTILAGTSLTAFGCVGIFCLGFISNPPIAVLWLLFICVNSGLGIRGPAGFFNALHAAGENESRGSALIILLIMATTALGTIAVAPFVEEGLIEVGALATCIAVLAVWLSRDPNYQPQIKVPD